jgi:hypothetical protein
MKHRVKIGFLGTNQIMVVHPLNSYMTHNNVTSFKVQHLHRKDDNYADNKFTTAKHVFTEAYHWTLSRGSSIHARSLRTI